MTTTAAMEKLQDGSIKLTITIPVDVVKKTWEEVVNNSVKGATVEGFRKGKAPKKLVESRIDTEKVREEVLKKLLSEYYIQAVKSHNIRPIVNPKIHVEKLDDPTGEKAGDWQFIALTCEAPTVDLGNYKEQIKQLTAKSKIIIPGKEPQQISFEEITKILLENTTIKIPEMLSNHEVERLLSQTLDEIKSLGLTLDQYLSSTNKTPETLREEYKKRAENDIKLEFALQQIAETEHITVEDKEIQEATQIAKSDEERKNLEANRYLLASVLRQQKTLDFLRTL